MGTLSGPGGETAYPYSPGPDNDRLPDAHTVGEAPVRWRHLPPAEIVRRKAEDAVRYYAQRHGKILTVNALGDYIGWKIKYVGPVTEADLSTALNDPVTVANLRAKGVLGEEVETWGEALAERLHPSGRQMDALDAIFERIDPDDPRPLREILAEHQVDLKTWNGWLADPLFAGYVRDRTAAVFGDRAHEVDIALMRRAIAGDVPAMKLILELQGRLRADSAAVDAGQLLGWVLEVLLDEVEDQLLLERIARRMEALSQGAARGQLPPAPPPRAELPAHAVIEPA